MRAWVLHGIGDIRLEHMPVPVPKAGEALVRVKAAGICGSDIPRIYETGAHKHPLIPGHEFAGVVESVGAGADESLPGKPVGVFPLIPCGKCGPCRNWQYEMCRNYNYLGSRTDGGFAEYVVVPVKNLVTLPDGVGYAEAAMLEPMAVAVHAMRRVFPEFRGKENEKYETEIFQGELVHSREKDITVAVCGLGTIGLLLIHFLRERGIRNILAIGNKDYQKEMLKQCGLSDISYWDSRKGDVGAWLSEITEGAGADVFFECVGKNEMFSLAVNHTGPGGTVCLVGNPHSDMTLDRDVYWKILRNQLTLIGTWNSSFNRVSDDEVAEKTDRQTIRQELDRRPQQDDWQYVLERLKNHTIQPQKLISHRFSLENLEKGFRIMRDKSEDFVKIMMRM